MVLADERDLLPRLGELNMRRNTKYKPTGVSNEKNTKNVLNQRTFRDTDYNRGRISNEKGRLLPKFTHSRTNDRITTFSDVDYLTAAMISLDFDTANSLTAFKNLCIAAYKEGHTSGNMKDIVSAEETAFSLVCLNAFLFIFDLIWQQAILEFVANPVTSDTTDTDENTIAICTYTTLAHAIARAEGKGLWVPDFIMDICRAFCWAVKLQDEYNIGAKVLPPRYFLPFVPRHIGEDLDTIITAWSANCAQAKLHMDKFGVRYSSFSESMIFSVPEKDILDPDVVAYFNHCPLTVESDGGGTMVVMNPHCDIYSTATWTTVKFYFKRDPNDSIINVLFPLLYRYHATNNPYGGILSKHYTLANTQASINMMKTNYDNTGDWTVMSDSDIGMLFLTYWVQTDVWNVTLTGTYRAADADQSVWHFAISHGLLYGTGLTKSVIEDGLKMVLIFGMYGGGRSAPREKRS